jgi:hypothetical protein
VNNLIEARVDLTGRLEKVRSVDSLGLNVVVFQAAGLVDVRGAAVGSLVVTVSVSIQ